MGFLEDLKGTAADFQEEYDRETDPSQRLMMRVAAFAIGAVATLVVIALLVMLAKIAIYLIPGFLVAGGMYWYVYKNRNNKDKPDFRKD